MKDAPKVTPPILLYWPITWETKVVGMVTTAMWKTSQIPDDHALLPYHKMKSILVSSSMWTSELQSGNWVQGWITASMHRKLLPGLIATWRLWSTLLILAGLSYHTHYIVWIWCFLTSIYLNWCKMDCLGNVFLVRTSS